MINGIQNSEVRNLFNPENVFLSDHGGGAGGRGWVCMRVVCGVGAKLADEGCLNQQSLQGPAGAHSENTRRPLTPCLCLHYKALYPISRRSHRRRQQLGQRLPPGGGRAGGHPGHDWWVDMVGMALYGYWNEGVARLLCAQEDILDIIGGCIAGASFWS